jgi:hypothetical protein
MHFELQQPPLPLTEIAAANPTPDPKIHDALVASVQFSVNVVQALGMPAWIRTH